MKRAIKNAIWKAAYSRWRAAPGNEEPGYSLLLLVPGDLPVFLRLAADVCGRLDPTNQIEALVIPDRMTDGFARVFADVQRSWPHGNMRLVTMPPLDSFIARRFPNPHTFYFLQLINGIEAARATHVLLHDADLFITNHRSLRDHYQRCTDGDYACLGAEQVWDDWFRHNGYDQVVGTWELMMERQWALSHPPYEHHGHVAKLNGVTHEFDATLLPQCRTDPRRIGLNRIGDFVHFNYVIGTHRWFQQADGPFEDEHFRLLLIRLLIDACDPSDWPYDVPDIDQLVSGIEGRDRPVTYTATATRGHYPAFRSKLTSLLECGVFDNEQIETMRRGVEPFDHAFAGAALVST